MTNEKFERVILKILGDIAPEADLDQLDPDQNFRDQLDIDSMDFLNFVIALQAELGIDIAERDYPKLSAMAGCIAYLAANQPAPIGA